MGHRNELVEKYIDPGRYDLLIYLQPDVKWVADGQRLNGDEERRKMLNSRLMDMYIAHGFQEKLVIVSGDYSQRLAWAIELVDQLLAGAKP